MAKRRSRELVLEILRHAPPGRLLDIPSGDGVISEAARAMGYRACELDLFPRRGMQGVQADACAALPFQTASFDALVSLEGIEHFEDQTGFLRECARVLRPGGLMVLTTPNVMHLSSRVSAFWTGQRMLRQGFVNEVSTLRERNGERLYHGHAYLIDAFRLRYILRVVGMRVRSLELSNPSPGSMMLAPLVPAVWAATRYAIASGRKRKERQGGRGTTAEVERDLSRTALSPALLFGKKLVVVAEREPESGTVRCPPAAGAR
jgi:SAM-dependent methyltransferase